MENTLRRYDIDWLRVIAIGFLLIYHVAIPFQPWGVFFGFIKSPENLDSIWIPMSMINVWRIPLLFFVSGMGLYFSMKKRNWKMLLSERTRRILLPFIVGILTVVPLQVLIWQHYYNQELKFVFNPAHLWFLGNIFIYVLLLCPLFYFIKRNEEKWRSVLNRVFDNPIKLILIAAPFMLSVVLIKPAAYAMYAMTMHGFILGLLAFLFGFLFVFTGKVFWDTMKKWKWSFLSTALLMYSMRFYFWELEGPKYLMALETVIWIYGIFGLSFSYLNFNNKYLSYLSEAAYPVYIVHWIFIHLGSLWIFNINIPVSLQFIGLAIFTFFGSILAYHYLIRNLNILRPLFGLKLKSKAQMQINPQARISL
ncbi:acyltransferase [Hyphobacterium sp. CCMP332]|nr:acyltransferase [Hyphobacterium sp. CCMP332]